MSAQIPNGNPQTSGRQRLARRLGLGLLLAGGLGWLPSAAATASDGLASYYGSGFQGRRTASGQRFDNRAMTAAHRTLRFGTKVRVTHARNGRDVIVTVNDRGPFVRGRVIDLSRAAAKQLGMLGAGVVPVGLEVVDQDAAADDDGMQSLMLLHKLF
jgi:rare lipoprotein A